MATERNCSDANKRPDKDTKKACRQMFERRATGRLLDGPRAGFWAGHGPAFAAQRHGAQLWGGSADRKAAKKVGRGASGKDKQLAGKGKASNALRIKDRAVELRPGRESRDCAC